MNGICKEDEYAGMAKEVMKAYGMMEIRAACSINRDTLQLYWSLGEKIASEDTVRRHGTHFIGAVSRRFREEMPDRDCFTATNLGYMRRFYLLYRGVQDMEMEGLYCLPWEYHKSIMDRCAGDTGKALYYAALALSTGMSKKDLKARMDLSFYEGAGRPVAELKFRLPDYDSDLGRELLQDMQDAEACSRRMPRKVREPMKKAVAKFLMYKGLSLAGMDYRVRVGERHVCLDAVMYSRSMRRFVLVEFVPEAISSADKETILLHAAALDEIREEGEGETIGLVICRAEDGIHARYVCHTATDLSALPAEEVIEASLA